MALFFGWEKGKAQNLKKGRTAGFSVTLIDNRFERRSKAKIIDLSAKRKGKGTLQWGLREPLKSHLRQEIYNQPHSRVRNWEKRGRKRGVPTKARQVWKMPAWRKVHEEKHERGWFGYVKNKLENQKKGKNTYGGEKTVQLHQGNNREGSPPRCIRNLRLHYCMCGLKTTIPALLPNIRRKVKAHITCG